MIPPEGPAIEGREAGDARREHQGGAEDAGFIPALRFSRLTPLFDLVAAVGVHDGAVKRRVLACAAITSGEQVLDVGCGTATLAVATALDTAAMVLRGLGDTR